MTTNERGGSAPVTPGVHIIQWPTSTGSEWYVYNGEDFVASYRSRKHAERKAAELLGATEVDFEASDPFPGALSRAIGRDYRGNDA